MSTPGALRLGIGALMYLPSVAMVFPYSAIAQWGSFDEIKDLTEVLILEPTDYTFQRKLGESLDGG